MTTYNTYQEAKITNQECDVAVVTRIDKYTPALGRFISVMKNNTSRGGYSYLDKEKTGYPNINDGYYTICSPSDYCMTVEKFLKDNCKFDDGDTYLDWKGRVRIVGKVGFSKDACNDIRNIVSVDQAFILRAAALEEKKPRTKVEYVEVTDSIFDLRPDFEAGELFSKVNHARDYSTINNTQTLAQALHQSCCYRRIETPITWKEELYDYLDSSCEMSDDFDDSFTIEIEGRPLEFNLNDDEFVDMCKLVASLNYVN